MQTLLVTGRTATSRALAVSMVAMGVACSNAHAALERGRSNGVAYAVGGWSVETRQELMAQGLDYSVMLTFAQKDTGEYLADVNVGVRDGHGREVLALEQAGPIVLLGLAPGSYSLEVTRTGRRQSRAITVGERTRRQAFFYWPIDEGGGTRQQEHAAIR